jgi:uncharacterized protein YjbI with pentapeptide repeats
VLWFRGFLEKNKVMTKTLPELLSSDAWLQDVAPALSADGRALVKETLTQAAATLGEEESQKFAKALGALRAPSEEQLAWLRDVDAVQTLPESEKILNLSNILICHPDTGAPIDWTHSHFPEVTFKRAVFVGKANFTLATFMGEAYFLEATFTGKVNFMWARFTAEAQFGGAMFTAEAGFLLATFTGEAQFLQATFTGEADFQHTEFLGITIFRKAKFTGVAIFHAARFSKTVSFRWSDWGAVPDFKGTAWKDGVAVDDFHQLQTGLITGKIDLRQQSTSDPASRLQALRKMARDADDRPRELDYFALELQARYQGKGAWAKRFLVNLYGWFSDYGRGVFLPLRGLVELCLLSMLCYWVLADGDGSVLSKDRLFAMTYGVLPDVDWSLWDNALLLSLVNALPPLGASSWVRESSLEALYGSDIPNLVHVIAVGEGVIGLILLFLIALGLRNRFRL